MHLRLLMRLLSLPAWQKRHQLHHPTHPHCWFAAFHRASKCTWSRDPAASQQTFLTIHPDGHEITPTASSLSDQAEDGESVVQVMSPVSSEAEVPAEPAPAGRIGRGRPAERLKRHKGATLPQPTGPETLAGEAATPSQRSSPK